LEWISIIFWLLIINGALGGQYILNWMGNQPRFVGDREVGVSPGVMTWWREISKFLWAAVAVTIEVIQGKKLRYLWPGMISMYTIIICAFTGVIENIGFFYLPRYYSPHIYAPYVNVYLAVLPFFGKYLFNASVRKEHWIGISLVILGLAFPYIPRILGGSTDPKSILDSSAITWIVIINICLCSQQILNNKTVQTAFVGVGANALVVWREIWKLVFITSALMFFPVVGNMLNLNLPASIKTENFEKKILAKADQSKKDFLLTYYEKKTNTYDLKKDLPQETRDRVKKALSTTEYDRFFSLFEGSFFPNNWLPIIFVVLAGLTGYIYSFGFFKLARFSAHIWVPYTNVYLTLIPFVMMFFGAVVTTYQIIGAFITTAGLVVGVSDYKRNKVVEIERKS
jgi:drug/metabolite transporter (DMT)-like permease